MLALFSRSCDGARFCGRAFVVLEHCGDALGNSTRVRLVARLKKADHAQRAAS
jgi:hypothetical protein